MQLQKPRRFSQHRTSALRRKEICGAPIVSSFRASLPSHRRTAEWLFPDPTGKTRGLFCTLNTFLSSEMPHATKVGIRQVIQTKTLKRPEILAFDTTCDVTHIVEGQIVRQVVWAHFCKFLFLISYDMCGPNDGDLPALFQVY